MNQAVTSDQIETWQLAVGRSETRHQVLDVEILRRYAAAIGADLDVERTLPPLGHWAFFVDTVGPDQIGPDGHPKRGGGVIPAIHLPRRMFASSTIAFARAMRLGAPATLTLTLADVKHRSGKTGDLVFIEVDRLLEQDGQTVISERQTIVYRGAGEALAPITPLALPAMTGEEIWTPKVVDLFRYSAATFNSHRIHYDQPYATGEEGYPDLVVHGPFTAAKLFAFAQGRAASSLAGFSFRAVAPLFVGQSVRLSASEGGGVVEAIRCDGTMAMSATAQGL